MSDDTRDADRTATNAAYDQLIERIITWGEPRDDLRAAIIIGSRARTDRPADQWSDLDVLLFTADPSAYVASDEWLRALGEPWLTFLEGTAVGDFQERRVLFAGALDVDFIPIPTDAAAILAMSPETRGVIGRGIRVLFDKDGLANTLRAAAPEERTPALPPGEEDFLHLVNDYLYHAVWTAKKLRRGELWVAKMCTDSMMKWQLLQMLEWHAHAAHGPDYDTWHGGRFLEQWADSATLEQLRSAFATYDAASVARALLASLDLFTRLARETAARLGYPYPDAGERHAAQWVHATLAEL